MKKIIIIGPDRLLEALQNLILSIIDDSNDYKIPDIMMTIEDIEEEQ
jgi:hypothetical protein